MSGVFEINIVYLEAAFLVDALLQLGCVIRQEAKEIRAAGCTETVDFTAVNPEAKNIEIGFKTLEDGSIAPIADWQKLENAGVAKEEFLNKLTQKYAYLKTVDEAQKQGYTVVEEKNQVDGSIKVVLRKYG